MESLRTQPEVSRRRGRSLILAPAEVTSLTCYMNLHGKEYTCKSVEEPSNGNSGCGGKLND